MDLKFLDFEQPIAELEAKIDELRFVGDDSEINIGEEIERLKTKSESLTRSIFSGLTPWQIAQLARHPQRPYALDYIARMAPDFQELHGDRMYADDPALVGGVGRVVAGERTARTRAATATGRGVHIDLHREAALAAAELDRHGTGRRDRQTVVGDRPARSPESHRAASSTAKTATKCRMRR